MKTGLPKNKLTKGNWRLKGTKLKAWGVLVLAWVILAVVRTIASYTLFYQWFTPAFLNEAVVTLCVAVGISSPIFACMFSQKIYKSEKGLRYSIPAILLIILGVPSAADYMILYWKAASVAGKKELLIPDFVSVGLGLFFSTYLLVYGVIVHVRYRRENMKNQTVNCQTVSSEDDRNLDEEAEWKKITDLNFRF